MEEFESLVFKQRILESARGVLWRAEQIALERDVLVFVFDAAFCAKPLQLECALAAIRKLANTKIGIFPDIIDIVHTSKEAYITMEDVYARQLLNLLAGRRLNTAQLGNIASQLARGFIALHRAGLVYGNLRPENLFINEGSEPMLLDVSLLQFAHGQGPQQVPDVLEASPVYAAPEQYMAPEEVDTRADMFGLGLTLYALVSGVMPYSNLKEEDVLQQKLEASLPSPCDGNPKFPQALARLLQRLCEREPNDRPADWEEVLFDLHLAVSNEEPYHAQGAINSLIADPNPKSKRKRLIARTGWIPTERAPAMMQQSGHPTKKIMLDHKAYEAFKEQRARDRQLQKRAQLVMWSIWGVVIFLLLAIALKVWFL